MNFVVNEHFYDEVVLDVIPLDICGNVLGSPYLYDRKAIFYREENKYVLLKDGIEYVLKSQQSKHTISLIIGG